jgi:hypothetical protein
LKNLIIAFTSVKEWKRSKFGNSTCKFIESLKISKKKHDKMHGVKPKDEYDLCMIIVVFSDQDLIEGKFLDNKTNIEYDEEDNQYTDSDDLNT